MSRSSLATSPVTTAEQEQGAGYHAAARSFYCDVLGGRQVWPSERANGKDLWFQVGDALVAVRVDGGDGTPALLAVSDPTAMAERCWDAGFTVRVREAASGATTLVVTDPFGRRLALVPRGARAGRGASR